MLCNNCFPKKRAFAHTGAQRHFQIQDVHGCATCWLLRVAAKPQKPSAALLSAGRRLIVPLFSNCTTLENIVSSSTSRFGKSSLQISSNKHKHDVNMSPGARTLLVLKAWKVAFLDGTGCPVHDPQVQKRFAQILLLTLQPPLCSSKCLTRNTNFFWHARLA